jgi:hypothetical protein
MLFAHYGKDSKTCRNVRSVLLWNGTILTIGGVLVSFGMFFADPLPPVPRPTLLERIGYGAITLVIMSGGGLLGIYFGRWSASEES